MSDAPDEILTYRVEHHERNGREWYSCPLCGELTPRQMAQEHGPEHTVVQSLELDIEPMVDEHYLNGGSLW